jgi:isopenicillin-N epimerase
MPSDLARHWQLDPSITFLNHGSFGACPTPVLAAQREWQDRLEREPVRFLARELDGHLGDVREAIGGFVGADPDDLALIANATGGVNAVLRSLRFEPGDEIVTTDHEYNAVLNVVRHVAARDGAVPRIVALPFPDVEAEDIVRRLVGAVTPRTRLAVVSHVTSPTALVLPIERIVAAVSGLGVDVLVDGAHAPGIIPLDLDRLGAAYYAANLHKWVCAPKGAAFLHVRRDRQAAIRPATISHGANARDRGGSRFRLEFDWQGTLDPSAWLAATAAVEFVGGLVAGGWPAVMSRTHDLAIAAGTRLAAALVRAGAPARGMAPMSMLGSMVALPLPPTGPLGGPADPSQSSPLDADPLQTILFDRYGIEVPIYGWPVPAVEAPDRVIRLIRISAALHNDDADFDRLVEALDEVAA